MADGIAFLLNGRTSLGADGTRHSRAQNQLRVGGVDDGVAITFGGIALHQLDCRIVDL